MIIHESASRYAKAFFSLKSSQEVRLKRLRILQELSQIYENQPMLSLILTDPHIPLSQKKELIGKNMKDCNDESLIHFLYLLLEKNRIAEIVEITQEYDRLYKESESQVEATFITAIPVDEAILKILQDKLQAKHKKTAKIIHKIDPKILGGAVLIVDHHMIDGSIRERLVRLKDGLLAASSLRSRSCR